MIWSHPLACSGRLGIIPFYIPFYMGLRRPCGFIDFPQTPQPLSAVREKSEVVARLGSQVLYLFMQTELYPPHHSARDMDGPY